METSAFLSVPISLNTLEGTVGVKEGKMSRGMTVLPKLFLVFICGS